MINGVNNKKNKLIDTAINSYYTLKYSYFFKGKQGLINECINELKSMIKAVLRRR
jgi:hypothetical protein